MSLCLLVNCNLVTKKPITSTLKYKNTKGGIAQWQSIRLQIERSMVQLRVPPCHLFPAHPSIYVEIDVHIVLNENNYFLNLTFGNYTMTVKKIINTIQAISQPIQLDIIIKINESLLISISIYIDITLLLLHLLANYDMKLS